MKAVVLAAGEGTRLRPLTADTPKPLVGVNGKPLLAYTFEHLLALDVEEIVTVIGERGGQIVDTFGDSFEGTPLRYPVQPEPKGLAHALLSAESYLSDEFVVAYGDVIFEANLEDCIGSYREGKVVGSVLVMDVTREEARQSGVCVTDQDDRILKVYEKPIDPPTTLALPGFFVFDALILEACRIVTPSERGEYELLDAIDLLAQAGRTVVAVRADGWRVNVNTPDDIEHAEQLLNSGSEPETSPQGDVHNE